MEKKVLSGRVVAKEIENRVRKDVEEFYNTTGKKPLLVTIMVGNNPASATYVKMKARACARVGIENNVITLPEDTTTENLINMIHELNGINRVSGILIQHPLPRTIDEAKCFDEIAIEKDIDGVNSASFGKMTMKGNAFGSATPQAIMDILDYYHIPVEGLHAVVVGRSPILGKPVSMMLLNKNATVTICHTKTQNIEAILKTADLVVAACGQPEFIKKEWLKDGVVLMDAGYNEGNVGDISKEAYEISSAYTPVPGGVGPVTIAEVLRNTMNAEWKKVLSNEKNFQKLNKY